MFGHVVQADKVATVSAAGARCEVEGGLSMNKLFFKKKKTCTLCLLCSFKGGAVCVYVGGNF